MFNTKSQLAKPKSQKTPVIAEFKNKTEYFKTERKIKYMFSSDYYGYMIYLVQVYLFGCNLEQL